MTNLGTFIAELERRRVIQALIGRGIVVFAVLQVYEPVMHGLHLPEWTLTLVAVLLAAGFPVTIVLSWIFDMGPAGTSRTGEAPATRVAPSRRVAPARRGPSRCHIVELARSTGRNDVDAGHGGQDVNIDAMAALHEGMIQITRKPMFTPGFMALSGFFRAWDRASLAGRARFHTDFTRGDR